MQASFGTQAAGAAAPAPPPPAQHAPVAVAPPATGAMQSGVIEAGCSFNGTELRGEIGSSFQIACPANCQDSGNLWGTDVYTADSAICKAGIHAGLVTPNGGVLGVRLDAGRPAYRGSVRNGVRSSDYGSYRLSYAVFPTTGSAAPGPVLPAASLGAQVIEAGCSFNANQIRGEVGTVSVVSCPAGCAEPGALWGTDVYTSDSGICKAAIHAGLIAPAGGTVAVVLESGRPAYRGSVRNGISSSDYGSYRASFRVQRR